MAAPPIGEGARHLACESNGRQVEATHEVLERQVVDERSTSQDVDDRAPLRSFSESVFPRRGPRGRVERVVRSPAREEMSRSHRVVQNQPRDTIPLGDTMALRNTTGRNGRSRSSSTRSSSVRCSIASDRPRGSSLRWCTAGSTPCSRRTPCRTGTSGSSRSSCQRCIGCTGCPRDRADNCPRRWARFRNDRHCR